MKSLFIAWLLVLFSLSGYSETSEDRDIFRQAMVDIEHGLKSEDKAIREEFNRKFDALERAFEIFKKEKLGEEKRISELGQSMSELKKLTIADPLRPKGIVVGCKFKETDYFISAEGGCQYKKTGVVYSQPSTVSRTWEDATRYCDDLVEGGKTDWRLPTLEDVMAVNYPGGADAHFSFPMQWYESYWTSRRVFRDGYHAVCSLSRRSTNYREDGNDQDGWPVFCVRQALAYR